MKTTGYLINLRCTGGCELIPLSRHNPQSKRMRECVGGYFECAGETDTLEAWVNEEGIPFGLNPNPYIPVFLRSVLEMELPGIKRHIFGNVAITGRNRALSKKQAEAIKRKYVEWREKVDQ